MGSGIEKNNSIVKQEVESEQVGGSYRTYFHLIYKKTSRETEALIVYHRNEIPKKLLSSCHRQDADV